MMVFEFKKKGVIIYAISIERVEHIAEYYSEHGIEAISIKYTAL